MKQSTRVGFDATINGFDISIEFTRTTAWSWENYGADADGNRGMMMQSIDSDDATDITAELASGEPLYLDPPASGSGAISQGVHDAVEAYMDAHDPEAVEEPEEDCDDIGD